MADVTIGEYFDTADQVFLEVVVDEDGISLHIAGKDNGQLTATLFELVPAELPPFDADVTTVSAYFDK